MPANISSLKNIVSLALWPLALPWFSSRFPFWNGRYIYTTFLFFLPLINPNHALLYCFFIFPFTRRFCSFPADLGHCSYYLVFRRHNLIGFQWQTTWDREKLFTQWPTNDGLPINFGTPGPAGSADIVVEDTQVFQSMDGFGATLSESLKLTLCLPWFSSLYH